jgi:hypothetical protein
MAQNIFISPRVRDLIKNAKRVDVVAALNRSSIEVRDYIKHTFMGASSRGPKRLARNTGRMEQNTIARRAGKTPDGGSVGVTINVPYASTHFADRGVKTTVIAPTNAKALTVPILVGKNLRPPHPARYYAKTFAYQSVLYAVTRARGVFPIFSLRSSVAVKSRVSIEKDIAPYAQFVIKRELEKEVGKAL